MPGSQRGGPEPLRLRLGAYAYWTFTLVPPADLDRPSPTVVVYDCALALVKRCWFVVIVPFCVPFPDYPAKEHGGILLLTPLPVGGRPSGYPPFTRLATAITAGWRTGWRTVIGHLVGGLAAVSVTHCSYRTGWLWFPIRFPTGWTDYLLLAGRTFCPTSAVHFTTSWVTDWRLPTVVDDVTLIYPAAKAVLIVTVTVGREKLPRAGRLWDVSPVRLPCTAFIHLFSHSQALTFTGGWTPAYCEF